MPEMAKYCPCSPKMRAAVMGMTVSDTRGQRILSFGADRALIGGYLEAVTVVRTVGGVKMACTCSLQFVSQGANRLTDARNELLSVASHRVQALANALSRLIMPRSIMIREASRRLLAAASHPIILTRHRRARITQLASSAATEMPLMLSTGDEAVRQILAVAARPLQQRMKGSIRHCEPLGVQRL